MSDVTKIGRVGLLVVFLMVSMSPFGALFFLALLCRFCGFWIFFGLDLIFDQYSRFKLLDVVVMLLLEGRIVVHQDWQYGTRWTLDALQHIWKEKSAEHGRNFTRNGILSSAKPQFGKKDPKTGEKSLKNF